MSGHYGLEVFWIENKKSENHTKCRILGFIVMPLMLACSCWQIMLFYAFFVTRKHTSTHTQTHTYQHQHKYSCTQRHIPQLDSNNIKINARMRDTDGATPHSTSSESTRPACCCGQARLLLPFSCLLPVASSHSQIAVPKSIIWWKY